MLLTTAPRFPFESQPSGLFTVASPSIRAILEMAEIRAEFRQPLGCIFCIYSFFLLSQIQVLVGYQMSYFANLLIVGTATFLAAAILTLATGIPIVVLWVYQHIRAQWRYPVSPHLSLLRLEDLPPEFAATIENTVATLSPLGFRLLGYVSLTVPGTTTYQGILHNPGAGTIARCVQIIRNGLAEVALGFQTRFSDGTECDTAHKAPAFFAREVQTRAKGRSGLAYFDIEDPARLARLHAAAVKTHRANLVDTGTLDPIFYQTETIQRAMAVQVAAGDLKKRGYEYRYMRIGALKIAIKLVWPVSACRVRFARQRAERFLAETGL